MGILIRDFFKKMKIGIVGVLIIALYLGQKEFIRGQGEIYGALANFLGAIFGGGILLILFYFFKPSKEKKKSN